MASVTWSFTYNNTEGWSLNTLVWGRDKIKSLLRKQAQQAASFPSTSSCPWEARLTFPRPWALCLTREHAGTRTVWGQPVGTHTLGTPAPATCWGWEAFSSRSSQSAHCLDTEAGRHRESNNYQGLNTPPETLAWWARELEGIPEWGPILNSDRGSLRKEGQKEISRYTHVHTNPNNCYHVSLM